MSFDTWMPDELKSSATYHAGECWRFVEAQHKVSTAKLTDTAADQAVLERLIDETKPELPATCAHLDNLLAAPFRYSPYPYGSRFRRAGQTDGAFYAGEQPETAAAEAAFYRLLFFVESPRTPWPPDAAELSAFSVTYTAPKTVSLMLPPWEVHAPVWMALTDYTGCRHFADTAREAGIGVIRYRSVRDPDHGDNLVLLDPGMFTCNAPQKRQTWRIFLSDHGVRAIREFPRTTLEFGNSAFDADPRIASFNWKR